MAWTSVPGWRWVVAYRVGRIPLWETGLVHARGPSSAALVGSGVSGFDLGVGQQHHARAGGWWAAMDGLRRAYPLRCGGRGDPGGESDVVPGVAWSLAALAGLYARGGRRLDRRDERRWCHRCSPGAAPPLGPAAVLLPRTRTPGSGLPATGSGRAVAHRTACRPPHQRPHARRHTRSQRGDTRGPAPSWLTSPPTRSSGISTSTFLPRSTPATTGKRTSTTQ
jgi:hypothetical protein